MGPIALKILSVLQKLYGKSFINKTIGTKTNVVKPKELDTNAPTKNMYSPDAFKDPKLQGMIDEKIQEYAPYIFSNKNQRELMNYLDNAENLLKQKKRDFGVTDQLESVGKEKPEADIVDIKTGKKLEGIETLKEDLGLPPGVSPKSPAGKTLQELKRATKEADIARKDIDKTMDTGLENIFRTFMQQPSKDMVMEGKRRAVIRKILLKDNRINLPKDIKTSLENYDDLRGGGTKEMDPLTIFDTYYKRDTDKLETLDSIIDTAENEVKAADEFRFLEDGFDLKKPEKDLGDKLKDLPDDIDPDAMATGGRVGFASGTQEDFEEFLKKMEEEDKSMMQDRILDEFEKFQKRKKQIESLPEAKKEGILSSQMEDFINNYSDQMTFEQYLQMISNRKNIASGGISYLMGM